MSGTFVTVSGVDGSGKSTLVAALAARARALGRWPSVVAIAPLKGDPELVRRVTALPAPSARWHVRERWLAGYFSLVLADAGHSRIAPAIRDGALVVADRWIVDHVVNQRFFGVDVSEWLPLLDSLPVPDLALCVQVPAEVALRRIAARGKPGVGAGAEFVRFAAARFAELAAGTHLPVDGTADTAAVAAGLLRRLTATAPAAEAR